MRRRRRAPHLVTSSVVVIGFAVTGFLVASSHINYVNSEQRLTTLQTNLSASALGVAPEDLERRLGLAVGLSAEALDPASTFRRLIAPSMLPTGPFVDSNLVFVHDGAVKVLVHVGGPSVRSLTGKVATDIFERAARTTALVTTRAVGHGIQRFGYLISFRTPGGTFVASAGQSLPANRRITIPAKSPDAALDVALYFGATTSSRALIETNAARVPLGGTVSTAIVPFGTSVLTLAISPRVPLAGTWSELLPWGILGVGVLFTLGIGVMTERLVRQRTSAEVLAEENRQLFREQRNVSLTLQRSLLPKVLPTIEGVELAARYIPGEDGAEVGGDWYSVMPVDDHRFVFVVGDVSGRGISAATVMAGLRYTVRSFASLGFPPAEILNMAAKELHIGTDNHFATVLVGLVDTARGELTMASAGHLAALLVQDGVCDFVDVPVGVPLGVDGASYESTTTGIAPGSTLIAYTDGLIERRGESIDEGMQRLRAATGDAELPVDELLTKIVDSLLAGGVAADDTALLGIRVQTSPA